MLRIVATVLVLASGLVACGQAHHARSRLKDSARDYSMYVRWKKWQPASGYIEAKQRGAWLAARMRDDARLRVMGVQIVSARALKDDEAEVQMALSYTRAPDITVKQRLFLQKWKKINEMWMLTDEKPVEVAAPTGNEAPAWP